MIKTLARHFMSCALFFYFTNLFGQGLDDLADKYRTDKGSKWGSAHHFTRHYEKLLEHLKDSHISLLEIGTWKGSSLRMWAEYFPNAKIYSIDIKPLTAYAHEFNPMVDAYPVDFTHERVRFFVGKQQDPTFLDYFSSAVQEELDVIIDDGSHVSYDQQMSFFKLFKKVKPGGFYIIEDLSYHPHPHPTILEMQDILMKIENNEANEIHFSSYLEQVSENEINDALRNIESIQWFDSAFPYHGANSFAAIRKKGAIQ
ncbi:MAG TPA: class I SAM-dependent methyltransferase [Chlamydiales bacterium]|nr:class I SAM-dependent methyltransferase [Chlamydiales bacterium]